MTVDGQNTIIKGEYELNNAIPKMFERNFKFSKSVPIINSGTEKKKRSSFYDDYVVNSNKSTTKTLIQSPVFKTPDLTPLVTGPATQNSESSGDIIKKNIESVLAKKYGALDVAHTFDNISDKDIEANIQAAQETVNTNIDKGLLSKDVSVKLPNLVDGLALSFAAAEQGNSKAAKRAREATYTEQESPKAFDNLLLNASDKQPAFQPVKYPSFYNDYLEKKEPSQNNSKSWNIIGNAFGLPEVDEKPIDVSDKLNNTDEFEKENMRVTPESPYDVGFKATTQNQTEQDEKEKSVDHTQKDEYPKSFYTDYIEKSKTNYREYTSLLPKIKSVNEIGKKFNNFSYTTTEGTTITPSEKVIEFLKEYYSSEYNVAKTTTDLILDGSQLEALHKYLSNGVKNANRPANIGKGIWAKQVQDDLKWIDDMFGKSSNFAKALKALPAITIGIDTSLGISENVKNGSGNQETISDAVIDIGLGTGDAVLSGLAGAFIGGVPGAIAGILVGLAYTYCTDYIKYDRYDGKTFKQHLDSLF